MLVHWIYCLCVQKHWDLNYILNLSKHVFENHLEKGNKKGKGDWAGNQPSLSPSPGPASPPSLPSLFFPRIGQRSGPAAPTLPPLCPYALVRLITGPCRSRRHAARSCSLSPIARPCLLAEPSPHRARRLSPFSHYHLGPACHPLPSPSVNGAATPAPFLLSSMPAP